MNILEDFLTQFKGCLLVVSHDRYFMDKVCDTLFILEDDGSVAGFVGKCSEYIELLKEKEREAARDSKQAQKSGGGFQCGKRPAYLKDQPCRLRL